MRLKEYIMDVISYLSLETTILLSLFIFIVVLFCIGSVFNNGKKDEKKKEPFMSRRQKLKEYNKRERRN
jgi:hypothetical protein